jgi:hypothetical protein
MFRENVLSTTLALYLNGEAEEVRKVILADASDLFSCQAVKVSIHLLFQISAFLFQTKIRAMYFINLLSVLALSATADQLLQKRTISNQDLINAATAWQSDTQFVSAFLELAVTDGKGAIVVTSNAQFALDHENDEVNHKNVIDQFFGTSNAQINAANNVLVTQGNFQDVVNGLADLAAHGGSATTDPTTLASNRCQKVLPAVDTYFKQVAIVTNTEALVAPVPAGVPGC